MNLLKQNKVKLVVDIILIVGLIFTRIPFAHAPLWISPHCIIAGFWLLFTCLHLYQHWGLTKKLFKKRVVMKQKWTALTLSIFLLTCVSIVLLLFPTNLNKFHHILSEIYCIVVLVHILQKWKLLMRLFKTNKVITQK